MKFSRLVFSTLSAALLSLGVLSEAAADEPMVTDATPDRPAAKTADKPWPYPASLDAVIAAPASHRVLFENDRVRVLDVALPARAREPIHTHRWPSVMYIDGPARLRSFDGTGKLISESEETAPAPGKTLTRWFDPEGPHSVENTSDAPFHAIRVELKR